LLAFLSLFRVSWAQIVTNVRAEQEQSDIIVFYDLEAKEPCNIELYVSPDGGRTWNGPLTNLSGDAGKDISAGSKKCRWTVLMEQDQFKGTEVRFKVIAEHAAQTSSEVAPVSTAENSFTEIFFTEEEFNFGIIKESEIVTHGFTFSNEGKGDLTITNVLGSCGCIVPQYPKEAIKSGGKGTIKVTFNSAGKMGLQDKTITITSNARNSPRILHIKGVVVK